MERIKLSKGLIAFGGAKGIGKTRFSLKLANYLAEKEKVLFISYQDYRAKLLHVIETIDEDVNSSLEINSSFHYFELGAFLEMIKYIQSGKFSTVIIDDLDTIMRSGYDEWKENEKDAAIQAFLFMEKYLGIRIIKYDISLLLS